MNDKELLKKIYEEIKNDTRSEEQKLIDILRNFERIEKINLSIKNYFSKKKNRVSK
jgi:hypothetical protein